MKRVSRFAVVVTALGLLLSAGTLLAEIDSQKSFQQLAALEGNWAGKGSEGQAVEVSFRMTAGGSALMSEIHGTGHENMIMGVSGSWHGTQASVHAGTGKVSDCRSKKSDCRSGLKLSMGRSRFCEGALMDCCREFVSASAQ